MLNGSRTHLPNDVSAEELQRIRKRRQLARKTPEQRRKLLQYHRRHNEKDGRLFFCDYCDLFISSSPRCWRAHLTSTRHMDAVEGYYRMAAHVECVWLKEIQDSVARAQMQRVHEHQQARAGIGAATPLPAHCIAHRILVGGVVAPKSVEPMGASGQTGKGVWTPSVRVGGISGSSGGSSNVCNTHPVSNHSAAVPEHETPGQNRHDPAAPHSVPVVARATPAEVSCVSTDSSHHGSTVSIGVDPQRRSGEEDRQ